MKANELMIGDWIQVTNVEDTKFAKVNKLTENCIHIDIHVDWCEYNTMPIQLTEEILKANGWKDADSALFHGRHYVFIYGEKTTLTLNHWKDFYTFNICGGDRPLTYVHELQHALRMCGLTELADNFKIK